MVDCGNSSLPFTFPFFGLSITNLPSTHPSPSVHTHKCEHLTCAPTIDRKTPSSRPQWIKNRHVTQSRPIRVLLGNFLLKLKGKILFSFCYSVGRIQATVACGHISQPSAGNLPGAEENKVQREAKSRREESVSHLRRESFTPHLPFFLMECHSPAIPCEQCPLELCHKVV